MEKARFSPSAWCAVIDMGAGAIEAYGSTKREAIDIAVKCFRDEMDQPGRPYTEIEQLCNAHPNG